MIVSRQVTNTETFGFIDAVVFKILSRKVSFINRKDNRNCKKSKLRFNKMANFRGKLLQNYR